MQRIIFMGDMHCGHVAGLTPPGYAPTKGPFAKLQKEMWKAYTGFISELGTPDVLVVNGDAIDGRGERSGGRELWSSDRYAQCHAAIDCINAWNAKKVFMTYGTAYHTGHYTDFENFIADSVKGEIHNELNLDAHGVLINVRHHIGSSSVPHGRATALLRELMWNSLTSQSFKSVEANVLIRSHVHYHQYAGTHDKLAITLPALQAAQSIYGARVCSGVVHWGLVSMEINEEGNIKWSAHIKQLKSEKPKIQVLS